MGLGNSRGQLGNTKNLLETGRLKTTEGPCYSLGKSTTTENDQKAHMERCLSHRIAAGHVKQRKQDQAGSRVQVLPQGCTEQTPNNQGRRMHV